MNGFEAELRHRILSVVPHGFIAKHEGRVEDWQRWQQQLAGEAGVIAVSPFIHGQVMVSRPGMIRGARLQAVDPHYERQVSRVGDSIIAGSYDALADKPYGVVIGSLLARHLGVGVGDSVSLVLPQVTVTPLGVFPRVKRFEIVGVFAVGAQLDADTVFIHLQDGQRLFQAGNAVDGLRVRTSDVFSAPHLLPALAKQLTDNAYAQSWRESQGSLFHAMKMEKTMVTLLLLVIVAVAAFNIVAILTMMVADKRGDIAVLRTMGASASSITAIFMIQGLLIGLLGVLLGAGLAIPVALHIGAIVAWFEQMLGAQVFNPSVYFISTIPSVLKREDLMMVCASGLLLSVLATIYPALRAARVEPAEVLRYE
jgi:lipoprotein-releasing system permease protein